MLGITQPMEEASHSSYELAKQELLVIVHFIGSHDMCAQNIPLLSFKPLHLTLNPSLICLSWCLLNGFKFSEALKILWTSMCKVQIAKLRDLIKIPKTHQEEV
jgi:hypothetical protein